MSPRSRSATAVRSVTPIPRATVTPIVWLPGRLSAPRPWRQARDRGRGRRPASRRVPHAARTRSPSAPPAAPRKTPPIRSGPACQSASAASPPATATPVAQGRRGRTLPAPTGCRSRIAGGTARAERSGQSAKRRVARHPARSPVATAPGSGRASSSNGTNGWSSGPRASWATVPSAAPARLPSAPSASACTRYTAVTVRALAPRQRRIAIVPTFRARNARTAAATPMPPTSKLVTPTRRR